MSCKVSYSVMVFVERQGAQLEHFFEQYQTPVELFKDPSGKVDVPEMENFLNSLADFLQVKDKVSFYREVGQNNFELRAWGVLDSVLKMVESPKDIFNQPDRFLSYFLTPHPEISIHNQGVKKLTFEFAHPPTAGNLLAYLIGAVEGLPRYMGMPLANITPVGPLRYEIAWTEDQESLFDEQEKKRRQFHPEIVHSVMQSLQEHQQSIVEASTTDSRPEHIASEAFEKMVAIEVEKRLASWTEKQKEFDESFYKIKNDFYKMYDYFTRAQQIITLVSPTARKASVREAMRRVDWEHVQTEFPKMVESACDSILAMQDAFHMTVEQSKNAEVAEAQFVAEPETLKEPTDLNQLIDNVLESLTFEEKSIKVDRHLKLDKEVAVDPVSFAAAIEGVFENSVNNSPKDAEVKISTRSQAGKIQIEISDASPGYSDEKLQKIFDQTSDHNLKETKEIIQRHRGQISVSSRQGEGATYLIEFPG